MRLSEAFARDEEVIASSSLSDIFEEEPVPLDVFVKDKKFLANPELSPVQFEAVQHIERIYLPETFTLMAEEFGGYWADPVRMTNLITLQWGKGSSAPYEEVYDAGTGQWTRLDAWKGGRVASHNLHTGEVGAKESSEGFYEADGSMFRVTTRRGLQMDVWEGHRFLTWKKRHWGTGKRVAQWAEAKTFGVSYERLWDLAPGDPIAVATSVPEPEFSVERDDREVEWLGLLLGDGHIAEDRQGWTGLTIGYDAPVELARVQEIAASYGLEYSLHDDGRKYTFVPKQTSGSKKRYGNRLRELPFEYGLAGQHAATKRVPKEFFSLPRRQVALLLSRLIDTDGWLSISNTAEIGFCSVSRGLVEDVRRLALRLGVSMEVRERKTINQTEGFEGLAYTARVRDAEMVARLASELTLLDKEPARAAVQTFADRVARRKARHGDILWDRIESVEYIGEGPYWSLTEPENMNYVAAGGIVNRNSGKDHVCRVSSLRVAYLLLCLKSPQQYYSMPDQDSIHLLNIASNSAQAYRAFFKPMTHAVRRGWFADKAEPTQNAIQYAKHIEAVSGHSEAESQEGLNLILGVADEIDAFKAKEEMVGQGKRMREATTSAESILEMLKTSASTRFPESYKRVAISFPRYQGSTIQKLTQEARGDIEEMGEKSIFFVSGPKATWEVNPRVKGKEQFATDYRKDPEAAAAKYECKPSRATDAYFRNPQIFSDAVVAAEQPVKVEYRLEEFVSDITGHTTVGWEPTFIFDPDFKPMAGARYALHGDLAVTGDRAGVAMSHVARWEERQEIAVAEDGEHIIETQVLPHLTNDFTISFSADIGATPPREIQIRWLRRLAFELIKRGFYIAQVTCDGFQSVDTLQTLAHHGIAVERVSTDRTPDIWKAVKDIASDHRLRMPFSALLKKELEALSRVKDKVDHPMGGSKDEADAFACSLVGAIAVGGSEEGGEPLVVGDAFFETGDALAPLFGIDPEDGLFTDEWAGFMASSGEW